MFTVDDVDINRVWSFYTNIDHLEVITPPKMGLEVIRSTAKEGQLVEGTEVWIEGKLLVKSRWHSKITLLKPFVYVDEMLEGRFKIWRHTHVFEQVVKDDNPGNATRIVDKIEYEVRYGIFGRLLEGYVERQLAEIFDHRRRATIKALTK